jgi:hypothetical protein
MKIKQAGWLFLLMFLGSVSAPNRANAAPHKFVRVRRVLLISVDGLHAIDLSNCVAAGTCPSLAQLSATGVTYSNASTSKPSDSFPGLLSMITGGSPVSTGVWYDAGYDRGFFPPGTTSCTGTPGAPATYDETIDTDLTRLDGGVVGSLQSLNSAIAINPANLPVGPDCKPVYPHSFLRVNTVFEVAKSEGLYTAWSDKHAGAYEIVNGPSGTGVDDFYGPEINSNISSYSVVTGKPNPSCTGTIWTDSICAVEFYDNLKVQAILHEIDGFDHTGTKVTSVPAIFGMNFQSVSVGQKLASDPAGATGYADVNGTPNPGLLNAIQFVDTSIGSMVSELQKNGIYNDTLIIVTAKHGQSPIDINKVNNTGYPSYSLPGCSAPPPSGKGCRLDDSPYTTLVPPLGTGGLLTDDDVALLWLPVASQGQTSSYVAALSEPANEWTLGIKQIYSGNVLKLRYNDPLVDSRTPDIVVEPNYGVIYTGGSKIAEHGGISEDDTHVALLVSNPGFSATELKLPVTTMEIAPTILRALRIKPWALEAVQIEKTTVLPGLFFDPPFVLPFLRP